MGRAEAEALKEKWTEGLAELNRQDDGPECVIACGMARRGDDASVAPVFERADQNMYGNKSDLKSAAGAGGQEGR